ncbi:MAG TPA: crossover junction endodeoxyribonuclease RuvC [Candidatus Polarisedimenticolia bacterium]
MRILGIDPGSTVTGFGIVEYARSHLTLVVAGVIRPGRARTLPERLGIIGDGLRDLLREHCPQAVSIERVFQHANVHSALVLAHIRGALMLEVVRAGVTLHEYTALQVKKALVGNGHADKDQVRSMVVRLLKVREIPAPHDVSDALAVAICHAHSSESLGRRGGS